MEKTINIHTDKLCDNIIITGELTEQQKTDLEKTVQEVLLKAIKNAEYPTL